MMMRKETE
jgi:hypothetical protein